MTRTLQTRAVQTHAVWRRPLPDVVAVLVGALLVGGQALRLGQWIVDDAAITYAYARSIDEGYGPAQQPGAPPVEGYSNPAWLALLVAGRRLRLFDHGALFGVSDLVWFPKVLALLCVIGMLASVAFAARAVLPGRAWAVTLLAGAAMAGNFSLVVWLFSGLENPLYGLAVTALAAVLARSVARDDLLRPRTAVLAGLLALLAALTRPDGIVYAAAYPLAALLLQRPGSLRPIALSGTTFALPYAAHLLWRHAEFGRWVPNTAVAKAQRTPSPADLAHTTELIVYAGWALALAALACTATALVRPDPGASRRALTAVLVPLSLALTAYGMLQRDWMALYRFATPVWTLAAFAGSLAAVTVWDRERPRGRALLVSALVVGSVLSLAGQRPRAAAFQADPTLSMCFVADRYGRLFNTYADELALPDAGLLLPDLGGTLLTTRLRVTDLAGLTDPAIADAYAAHDTTRLRTYVFDHVRPTFIHVHSPWSTLSGLTPETLTAHGYVPLSTRTDTGDWIRSAAVPDPTRLRALQNTTLSAIAQSTTRRNNTPTTPCGPRLTPPPPTLAGQPANPAAPVG
ncbi:hypothetical protein [Streptomyces sp. H39-S7]|uniref:hypothetical protein n=1 Tax=Streptomyces sp. H39-S7 TaxID=3004357 RepID=UPI0022AFA470|nr:hypothetical protein [Streptomyces sp. H39-S7]MCZ4125273.1 hypothetical protein [Streptomyces sp. H39-S7]